MFKFLASVLSVLLIGASFKAFAMDPPADEEKDHRAVAAARPPTGASENIESLYGDRVLLFLSILGEFSGERLQAVSAHAHELFSGNEESSAMAVTIRYLAKVPPTHFEDAVAVAQKLFSGNEESIQKACIIRALGIFSPERLKAAFDAAQELFRKDLKVIEKVSIIRTLGQVPPENLKNVVAITRSFSTGKEVTMNAIIRTLAEGEPDQLDYLAYHIVEENPDFAETADPVAAIEQFLRQHPHRERVKATDRRPPVKETGAGGKTEEAD